MVKFGDIFRCREGGRNRQVGDVFKVIIPEGDGKVGLKEHSLCYKYVDGVMHKEYLYEIPWTDMEPLNEAWHSAALKMRAEPIEIEIKKKQQELKSLEKLQQLYSGGTNKEDYIKDFSNEIKELQDLC